MEWQAPAIVLTNRPFGEADALVSVLTAEHGLVRGLVHGGNSRARAGSWQLGNLLTLSWTARSPDQLGRFAAELVHPGAALAMDDPLALSVLSSACAVADSALLESEPQGALFEGLLHLVSRLSSGPRVLGDLIRWELALLAELGYGLDLATCALTGSRDNLTWVSPRSGRAVSETAAAPWKERLLPLPKFLAGGAEDLEDYVAGLALTGHFLARHAFGTHHRGLPPARQRLTDRVAASQRHVKS